MNQLSTTLISLSFLIESLNNGRYFYSGLMKRSFDYVDLIQALYKQTEELQFKLMIEYKRLSKADYVLNNNLIEKNTSLDEYGILDECLKTEEELINLYAETMREDVLWEVLPVLAQQLMFLNISKDVLQSNLQHA